MCYPELWVIFHVYPYSFFLITCTPIVLKSIKTGQNFKFSHMMTSWSTWRRQERPNIQLLTFYEGQKRHLLFLHLSIFYFTLSLSLSMLAATPPRHYSMLAAAPPRHYSNLRFKYRQSLPHPHHSPFLLLSQTQHSRLILHTLSHSHVHPIQNGAQRHSNLHLKRLTSTIVQSTSMPNSPPATTPSSSSPIGSSPLIGRIFTIS